MSDPVFGNDSIRRSLAEEQMSNITHYGYTAEQIKGMASEIERLREHISILQDEIDVLRAQRAELPGIKRRVDC
jgi:TolA-binding protein